MTMNIPAIRAHFPSLQRPAIFFDNPGGTQIAKPSLDRIIAYLTEHNANHEGAFETSRLSDAVLEAAHSAVADFFNAASPREIVFGANMTTLTLHISRSLARRLQPGDSIVVTRLDHDANITPWTLVAEERGCRIIWVDFHPEDGTLNMEEMQAAMGYNPKLVAVGYASNALGTINPLSQVVKIAHEAGAMVYVDAVQYTPHGLIDVQELGCDFLVASAYKFFGPHVGALYGRLDLLEELFAYKVRPAPDNPPGKFETGTLNHEGIAGVLGAIEYLEWVGANFGASLLESRRQYSVRRLRLKQAMSAIRICEYDLSRALLETLEETPGVTIYGLRDLNRLSERVPTVSFRLKGWHPKKVAEALDKEGIYVWDGNYYALAVTQRLGVEDQGGMVRVGAVHYNTLDEIQQFREVMGRIASKAQFPHG